MGECPYCRRELPIGNHGACRLCWQQGMRLRGHTAEPTDLAQANRFGQQLFLANMHYQPRKSGGKPNAAATGRSHSYRALASARSLRYVDVSSRCSGRAIH